MVARPHTLIDPQQLALAVAALNEAMQALAPADLSSKRLSSALAEIGAAREESDAAAMQILDVAETLAAMAGGIDEPEGIEVMHAADAIFQACTMNDIVGQRLAKAAAAVSVARERLAALSIAFDLPQPVEIESAEDARTREKLTFGPAIGAPQIDQASADRLFATPMSGGRPLQDTGS